MTADNDNVNLELRKFGSFLLAIAPLVSCFYYVYTAFFQTSHYRVFPVVVELGNESDFIVQVERDLTNPDPTANKRMVAESNFSGQDIYDNKYKSPETVRFAINTIVTF